MTQRNIPFSPFGNAREDLINQTASILDCQRQQRNLQYFYHIALAPALAIILILAFLVKRKKSCLNLWNGRPGIPIPVNLLDEFEHRWSYAIAFGAITNTVLDILLGGTYLDRDASAIEKALLGVYSIFEASVNFYPFFACLFTPHRLVGSFLGFCYASLWLAVQVYLISLCPNPDSSTLPYATLWQQIPTMMCILFLIGKFARETFESLHRGVHVKTLDTTTLAFPEQMEYVKDLLRKPPQVPDCDGQTWAEWFTAMRKKYMYDSRSHFVASTRIITTLFVIANVSYQIMILSILVSGAFSAYMEESIKSLFNQSAFIEIFGDESTIEDSLSLALDMFQVAWWITSVFSALLYFISIFGILNNYRTQSLMLYKGDKSFLPYKYMPKSAIIMANGQKFSGYQIAYFIWGIVVVNIVVLALLLLIFYLLILPPIYGNFILLEYIILVVGVPSLISVSVILITSIASDRAFLQDKFDKKEKDKPLALDNRKWYHVNAYFLFLFTVATGLFASLFRILQGGFFGIIYLGRCDRCVLMPGFESLDRGYASYIGMLLLENTHNHPVLRVFCQILVKNKSNTVSSDAEKGDIDQKEKQSHEESSKRARIRWWTLYTMTRNPSVVLYRKNEIESITSDSVQKDLANYRLYAKTKLQLEELEKKIFRESVYEGLFSRNRNQSDENSFGAEDKKPVRKRLKFPRKNKVDANGVKYELAKKDTIGTGTLVESAEVPSSDTVINIKVNESNSDSVESTDL